MVLAFHSKKSKDHPNSQADTSVTSAGLQDKLLWSEVTRCLKRDVNKTGNNYKMVVSFKGRQRLNHNMSLKTLKQTCIFFFTACKLALRSFVPWAIFPQSSFAFFSIFSFHLSPLQCPHIIR